MNNLTILITPVANGFLVTLPFEVRDFDMNRNPDDFAAAMAAGVKMLQGDSVLNQIENDNKKIKPKLAIDENTFIFDSMEKVLAFLAERYL
jgi:hypothetical protein